jgi:hypothetical protein
MKFALSKGLFALLCSRLADASLLLFHAEIHGASLTCLNVDVTLSHSSPAGRMTPPQLFRRAL